MVKNWCNVLSINRLNPERRRLKHKKEQFITPPTSSSQWRRSIDVM